VLTVPEAGTNQSANPVACELWGKRARVRTIKSKFCLDIVRMSRSRSDSSLDQYELAVDEIVAACDGDLRAALRALMLLNEKLEQQLEQMSGGHPPHPRLH
jgi:hypothetical protein